MPVKVTWKEFSNKGEVVYYASCSKPGLYSVEVDIQMKGLKADQPLPLRKALWGPFRKKEILRLTATGSSYSTRSTYHYCSGGYLACQP